MAANQWKVFGSVMVEAWRASRNIFILLIFATLLTVAGMTESQKRELVETKSTFRKWVVNLDGNTNRGSFIDLPSQFQPIRDGIASTYKLMQDPAMPAHVLPDLEAIAVASKMTILKTLYTLHPERCNNTYEVLSLVDQTRYTENNTRVQKHLSFVARYNAKYHDPELDGNSQVFRVFLELGMDPSVTLGDGIIAKWRHAGSPEYSGIKGEVLAIGCQNCSSPLCELRLPLTGLRNNDVIEIEIETPVSGQGMPFSIYDLQVQRYWLGVRSLRTMLTFDRPIWPTALCFDDNMNERNCAEDEGMLTYSPRASGTNFVEFERNNPQTPVTILFTIYPQVSRLSTDPDV